jgi:twinkle protein
MSLLQAVSAANLATEITTLYRRGLPRGCSTGWRTLDEHYTVAPGQWTLVTGIPGHGKSELVDALMVNLAVEKWHFVVFSPENQPHELHIAKLLEKFHGKPFGHGPTSRMDTTEIAYGSAFIDEHFKLLRCNKEFVDMPSPHLVIDAAAREFQAWIDSGVSGKFGLVIDPWNEMDHGRPATMSETEYISQTLSSIRQFCRDWRIHIWLIAHPKQLQKDRDGKINPPRPYDISGSAHWYNKSDNIITVFRDTMNGGPVQIHVQKIRFKQVGKPGLVELGYDHITGRYFDAAPTAPRFDGKSAACQPED